MCVCAHASLARALRRKEATSRKYRHRVCVELLVDEPTAVSGERIGKGYQDTRAIITSSNTPSHLAPTSGAAVCCCTRQRTSLSSNDHSSSLQTSRTNRLQQYRRKKKREGTNLLDGQRNDLAALAGPPNHGSAWGPCARPLRWIESVRELPPLSRFELRGEEVYSSTASGAAELAKILLRFLAARFHVDRRFRLLFATRTYHSTPERGEHAE